jgi:hypothetical protein
MPKKREALVVVLAARKLSLRDEQKKRRADTNKEEILDRWITIALTIRAVYHPHLNDSSWIQTINPGHASARSWHPGLGARFVTT